MSRHFAARIASSRFQVLKTILAVVLRRVVHGLADVALRGEVDDRRGSILREHLREPALVREVDDPSGAFTAARWPVERLSRTTTGTPSLEQAHGVAADVSRAPGDEYRALDWLAAHRGSIRHERSRCNRAPSASTSVQKEGHDFDTHAGSRTRVPSTTRPRRANANAIR